MKKNETYITVPYPNPHLKRMREILIAHPEVKSLFGPNCKTFVYALGLVLLQIVIAGLLKNSSWGLVLIVSYGVGSFANHALFVIIHECTHNLVFKHPTSNKLLGIFVNFPQFFPSAMAFSKYHMLHHSHQSEYDYDPDIASPQEAHLIGNSRLKKALFLAFFGLVQALRPLRLKKVDFLDRWIALNFILQLLFLAVIGFLFGLHGLGYFLFSTLFALGLHPLGARWIQEHYVLKDKQETYSYYGPLNKFCFNMGYHNEHHDFMKVPWSKLPELRKMAPEYYDNLYYYQSWTRLIFRFIFDKKITLFDRVVRFAK